MVRRTRMNTTTYVELDEPEATTSHNQWVQEIAALPEPPGGRFGAFGGQYVAETLMPAITELEAAWRAARGDAGYWAEVDDLLVNYVGRPSLLYHARRLSAEVGAQVHAVESGTRTLKDAMNEALRDWVTNVADTFYMIGSVAGPHPYPWMVRDLQSIIGREARAQIQAATSRLPDACVACVGGGSNAAGLFAPFVANPDVRLIGVEAAGDGIATGRHAATLSTGRVGVLHGSKSYVLVREDGQIAEAHSISAGLDYPGVGPEHAAWKASGRATYLARTDEQALAGLERLARTEGILCALETAHAIAGLDEVAAMTGPHSTIVLGLSGRGDKDMITVANRRSR